MEENNYLLIGMGLLALWTLCQEVRLLRSKKKNKDQDEFLDTLNNHTLNLHTKIEKESDSTYSRCGDMIDAKLSRKMGSIKEKIKEVILEKNTHVRSLERKVKDFQSVLPRKVDFKDFSQETKKLALNHMKLRDDFTSLERLALNLGEIQEMTLTQGSEKPLRNIRKKSEDMGEKPMYESKEQKELYKEKRKSVKKPKTRTNPKALKTLTALEKVMGEYGRPMRADELFHMVNPNTTRKAFTEKLRRLAKSHPERISMIEDRIKGRRVNFYYLATRKPD